jgi:hypothetical protein
VEARIDPDIRAAFAHFDGLEAKGIR